MKHEHITEESQETAALFALGALCQHEARAYENHLRDGCSTCETEVARFEQVTGLIGSAAPVISPPAYLRDLLAARIEKEEQIPARRPEHRADVIPFPDQSSRVASRTAQPSRSPARAVLPWAIAATLLIAFAYSFYAWQTDRRELQASISKTQQELAQLSKAKDELAQINKARDELAQINAVLESPDHRVIAMEGQKEVAPSSTAKVYWDVQNKRWVVTGELPPAPAGKAYQLWFITPEAKVSAGVMKTDQSGHVFAVVNVPPEIGASIQATAFTLEPETGSPEPTMPIYVVGKT